MKLRLFFSLIILGIILSCSDDDESTAPIVVVAPDDTEEEEENQNPPVADGRLVCENGFAGVFPCDDFDLMAQIDLSQFGNSSGGNDIWGWTDPVTNTEYALFGQREGTSFIDISTPTEPRIVGFLPSETSSSQWRDIKVYNEYAFIVSEASEHGMQVFDLSLLRDIASGENITFTPSAVYTEFGNAHNIVINEQQAFAYVVGTSTFSGGPHIVDISNPLNPTFAGGFSGEGYTHDAQVVTYNGPDADYTGREIYIGSNEDEVVIIDVTDKTNIFQIAEVNYPNIGYTHQGWLTKDQDYFIANDELDESNVGFNTRTLLFDFTDLDNPTFSGTFTGDSAAIDHNLYVKGNEVFLSNYTRGIRVADISDIATGNLFDTGSFDTFPSNNNTSFNGVWSIYPYFDSNNIIVSDIDGGLFILRRTGT
ncbi:choice-of-anchor B family protein [uncultured Dokdonia sp.]|uniref:choice-of-anchor B family protein n=1 Tax=uncultured Dokdonia sp. TaxID=575653 RepID=UPI0026212D4A|nr:choice-of-anchor B family protein [uncultured Dokdonia sp.]